VLCNFFSLYGCTVFMAISVLVYQKVSARGRDEGVEGNVACVATSHDLQKKFLTQDTEVLLCILKLCRS
jgi:hypothetical protein